MDHIVQFAVSIDDNAITQRVTDAAEKKIIDDLKQQVANRLFQSDYYRGNADPERNPLSEYSKRLVENFLTEYKDAIITNASQILADKLARSKAGKEIFKDLT